VTARTFGSLRPVVVRLVSAAAAAVCAGGFVLAWPAAAAAAVPAAAAEAAVRPSGGSQATAGQDKETWAQVGRPDRLIIIRATSVDAIQDGRLLAHFRRAGGTVTVTRLAVLLGSRWISMPAPGTAVLSAALLLSPGTRMQVGPDVRRLYLTGGKAVTSASWIRCEQASLTIRGVALSSLQAGDGAGGPPVPMGWQGRPYVYAAGGARLDVSGSTISDLGAQMPRSPVRAAVTWGKGSTGSAVNARFEDNEVGLILDKSVGVRLSNVTVENSDLEGLVLRGDRGTMLTGVISRHNDGDGIIISGTGPRHLSGLIAAANAAAGVAAVTQTGLVLTGVQTSADQDGGVQLSDCQQCTVNGLVAVSDEPTALTISGGSGQVSVTGANLHGGNDDLIGITIAESAHDVALRGVVVTGFRDLGVGIGGKDVSVLRSQITGSPVAVRVYGSASKVQLASVTIRGAVDGVVITHTVRSVSLSDITVAGVTHDGVTSASAGLRMSGGHIDGGQVGISLLAPADIAGVDVDRVVIGIHDRAAGVVNASRVDVVAGRYGIKADAGARVTLTDSVIRAPIALTGAGYISRDSLTVLSLPPVPWLGFAAITAVLLAIILQTIHQMRRGRTRAPRLPRHARRRYAGDFG
jgi:hypothetical protein